MIRSIIVAIAKNNAIGKNNDLIWHIPEDMRFFKMTTNGHCIITGRKNYESIPEKFRPLPNRTNIVVTRNVEYQAEGAIVLNSIETALNYANSLNEEEVFIIGGGQIYSEALNLGLVDKMYITHVDKAFEADTFFPTLEIEKWELLKKEELTKSPLHAELKVYVKK